MASPTHGPGGGPPAPPPPPGKGGHGGGKKGHGSRPNGARGQRINRAVTGLVNALMEKGYNSADALKFATMALKQHGVTIGRGGKVHYKGGLYNAHQFVNSPLIAYVTGAKAKAANEATLKADPNYQQALATLALARDQGNAALTQQRTQALTDFGDPTFVQNDPTLAAAVGANPFGTSRLLEQGYQQQRQNVGQTANLLGTNFGGGVQSGMLGAQHTFAGQQSQATSALQNLLNSLSLQQSQLGQNYTLGAQNALVQSQQNLAQQGLLSASAPRPKKGASYNLFKGPPHPTHGGGGGGGAPPPPPRQPRPPKPPPSPF